MVLLGSDNLIFRYKKLDKIKVLALICDICFVHEFWRRFYFIYFNLKILFCQFNKQFFVFLMEYVVSKRVMDSINNGNVW